MRVNYPILAEMPVLTKKFYRIKRTLKTGNKMTTTDYQQQATDFLKATGTTFTSTYKEHSAYFDSDKQSGQERDVYIIVLKNKQHRYRFLFGQSISNTGSHPTAYDVLACLTKYPVGSFEDFCGEFGYDTDSRSAYKIYKAVTKEWKNVELLFTENQLEQLLDCIGI